LLSLENNNYHRRQYNREYRQKTKKKKLSVEKKKEKKKKKKSKKENNGENKITTTKGGYLIWCIFYFHFLLQSNVNNFVDQIQLTTTQHKLKMIAHIPPCNVNNING
jgi:hypothetical protein